MGPSEVLQCAATCTPFAVCVMYRVVYVKQITVAATKAIGKSLSALHRESKFGSPVIKEKESGEFPIRSSSPPIMIPSMKYVEVEDIDPKNRQKVASTERPTERS